MNKPTLPWADVTEPSAAGVKKLSLADAGPDLYHIFFEFSNDALYLYQVFEDGSLGNFVDVNNVTCRRLGYTREELLKMGPCNIAHPDRISGYGEIIRRLFESKFHLVETEHISRSGKIIPVEVSSFLFTFNGIHLVFAIARDIKHRRISEAKLRKRSVLLIDKIRQRTAAIESITGKLNREIEGRINMETALKESENLFRAMADTVPVMIYMTDADKKITYFNLRWLEYTGRTLAEELGDGWMNSVHPDDLSDCTEVYYSAFDKYIPYNIEYRLRRFDGEYRWVLDHGQPVYSSSGRFSGYFGSCIDITERRNIEEDTNRKAAVQDIINSILSLPIEEITLDEILQRSLDLITGIPWFKGRVNGAVYLAGDENNRLTLKASVKQFKCEVPECREMNCEEAFPDFCLCGEDAFKNDFACTSYLNNSQDRNGSREKKQFCIPVYNGSRILGVISINSRNGAVIDEAEVEFLKAVAAYLSGVIIRKRSGDDLRKLSMVAEQSADLVLITDRTGKIEYVNKAFEELTGYTKEDWKDATPRILKSGIHDDLEYQAMWEKILSGKAHRGITINRKKSGETYYEEKTITPLKDPSGNITHFVSTGRDITERVRAEEELREAKEKAEMSEKLKSDFLAQMSHEIRTPINSILNFTSLLKNELIDKVPEELKDFFGYIDRGGRRLIRTIDLILNMSQVQSGTMELRTVKIDLSEDIVKDILPELMPLAKEKGLELLFKDMTRDGAYILGDLYTVRQIFENLIDNAVKFTFRGNVEVKLFRNNAGDVCASIQDTGIGISEEYLPKLFNPFSQEETGYSRRFEGNGLGLALVKKYAELNNASVEVRSRKGEGSCFTLTFKNF